jgi:hypothetical protein
MAKDPRFGRRLGVAIVSMPAALLAGAGGVHAQALSCTGLASSSLIPANPISCTVNCPAPAGTIASAVAMQPYTTSRLTITINGTCTDSVDDVPGHVTLQAASTGDGLQAPSESTDPVLGISGTGVVLTGLTISGGVNALRGRSGAAFTGTNLVIEKASNADVLLDHAVVTLNTSTTQIIAAPCS